MFTYSLILLALYVFGCGVNRGRNAVQVLALLPIFGRALGWW